MDKETLSNYGWIVICVLVLAVMIALAGPFGNFVADAVKSTTQGLFDVNQGALGAAGIHIEDNSFANNDNSGSNGGETPVAPSDTTYYTSEEIESDDHLFAVGSGSNGAKKEWVVAKFNDDYSEVVITKNGDDSTGIFASATTAEGQTYMKNVTSVIIKPGIVNIPEGTFTSSTTLKTISIPDTVTRIKDSAFFECSSLQSVDIPGSVKTIGNHVFQKCTSLTSVTLHDGLETIGGQAFQNCTLLTSITIPNTVTTLGQWAFTNCYALENVTLSNKITTIDEKTFYSCKGLKNIVIPEGVTSIASQAFGYCSKLESITIPSTVTTIADDAFLNCGKLTSIYGISSSYAETWATTNGYTFIAQ